ncbi:MAG TPA: zinc-ribbon domain-containing protein, partial [Nitrosopumilaceae archaeon]|nr:zinc-ribbon domain-containing protein [Nitrosopumilaceae archaeon]
MFCSSCGNELTPESSFCPKCGKQIGEASVSQPIKRR